MTMNPSVPRRAMVLAAGAGLRMRPLTLDCPKPLLTVAGRTLLDHTLDRLVAASVDTAVVNSCYLGDMIAAQLHTRHDLTLILSPETEALETGGGIRNALHHFGTDPFVAANADILWCDGGNSAVRRLAAAWDGARMDAVLLLMPIERACGYDGEGDFHCDGDGRLTRRQEGMRAPFVFAGVQIITPALFEDAPAGPFSTNVVWNKALAQGRLYGIIHDGAWFHVGTPEALARTNALVEKSLSSPRRVLSP